MRARWFALGVLGWLCAAVAVAATSGGFPSRPKVQALTVKSDTPEIIIRDANKTSGQQTTKWTSHGWYLCSDDATTCSTGSPLLAVQDSGGTTAEYIYLNSLYGFAVTGPLTVDGLDVATTASFPTADFTATLTGVSGSVTGSGYASIAGTVVCTNVPTLTGTSNATTAKITGLPPSLGPVGTASGAMSYENNGALGVGMWQVLDDDTEVNLYPGRIGTTWTASGTKTVNGFSMCWPIRW